MPETIIEISQKLREVLEKISHKSTIASRLLKDIPQEDLVENPVNYISISNDDPTKISYAYSHRLAKLKPDEDVWNFKGRIHAKPTTAIKKFLTNVKEIDLDIFTNLYRAETAEKNFVFKVVEGDDITRYYNGNMHESQCGSLGNSCMKREDYAPFFEIYVKNPEVCKMLIMLNRDGYLMGRALLWNVKEHETGEDFKIMDRIYCVDDTRDIYYFKEWADENGYLSRKDQKWQNSLKFEFKGKVLTKKFYTQINKIKYDRYPYLDTLKFYDTQNYILYNFKLPDFNKDENWALISAGGSYGYANQLEYDFVREWYEHREYMTTLNYEIDGIRVRTSSGDVVYSNCMDMSIALLHSKWDEELKDNIFSEEFSHLNDNDKIERRRKMLLENKDKMKKKISTFSEYYTMNEAQYQEYATDEVNLQTLDREVQFNVDVDHIATYIDNEIVQEVITQDNIQGEPIVTATQRVREENIGYIDVDTIYGRNGGYGYLRFGNNRAQAQPDDAQAENDDTEANNVIGRDFLNDLYDVAQEIQPQGEPDPEEGRVEQEYDRNADNQDRIYRQGIGRMWRQAVETIINQNMRNGDNNVGED